MWSIQDALVQDDLDLQEVDLQDEKEDVQVCSTPDAEVQEEADSAEQACETLDKSD